MLNFEDCRQEGSKIATRLNKQTLNFEVSRQEDADTKFKFCGAAILGMNIFSHYSNTIVNYKISEFHIFAILNAQRLNLRYPRSRGKKKLNKPYYGINNKCLCKKVRKSKKKQKTKTEVFKSIFIPVYSAVNHKY